MGQMIAIATSFIFVLIGFMGGMAFAPYFSTSADLLSKLNHFQPSEAVSSPTMVSFFEAAGPITCYVYPLVQCLSGIPVFCTVIRYNLLNGHILKSAWSANAIAIALPFVAAILLYHGNGFNLMLNWTGSVFSSFINFVLPIVFYYKALLRTDNEWERVSKSSHHLSLVRRSRNSTPISKQRAAQSEPEICDSVQNCKSAANSVSTESDELLFVLPSQYASMRESPQVLRDNNESNEFVVRQHEQRREAIRKSRHTLCFLAFATSLALAAFVMDFVPYFG